MSSSNQQKDLIPSAQALTMLDAFRFAVKEAIKEHHRAGRSVVIFRDGKLIEIAPNGDTK